MPIVFGSPVTPESAAVRPAATDEHSNLRTRTAKGPPFASHCGGVHVWACVPVRSEGTCTAPLALSWADAQDENEKHIYTSYGEKCLPPKAKWVHF